MAKKRIQYNLKDYDELKNGVVLPMKIKIFLGLLEDNVNKK
jgi:hypothetical protein